MDTKSYHNPVRVVYTSDWQESCRRAQADLDIGQALVVASPGTRQRLDLEAVFSAPVFSDITPNPTFESCQGALDFCRTLQFDVVIAIGGGSVLDTAKTIMAARGSGVYAVEQLLSGNERHIAPTRAIFLPTTHGTGSEVTMWATLWDSRDKKKYSLSHPALYPDVAILDASLTLGLPLDVSIHTVLDALSHALESIWNKNANPVSTGLAIEAVRLIWENTARLKENTGDLAVRRNLLTAANIAGLAFSNTRTAAAHSIGYPLTAHYGIPHGVASALALPPLLATNAPHIAGELGVLLAALKLTGLDELRQGIKELARPVNLDLRHWGVERERLDWLASQCFTKGRMDNNIVDLTCAGVRSILEEIY